VSNNTISRERRLEQALESIRELCNKAEKCHSLLGPVTTTRIIDEAMKDKNVKRYDDLYDLYQTAVVEADKFQASLRRLEIGSETPADEELLEEVRQG
jgi:hypothetical protein